MTRPESQFLRTLWLPLQEEARRDVELALKVAVGVEAGLTHDEIAARLGVTRGDVKAAAARLKRVRERLDAASR
jgi:predicted transcriptional regulator